MEASILKSQYNYYNEQVKRLKTYFKKQFPQCDGRQYPQIITCLNAFYKRTHSDDELKKIITDGDGDSGLSDAFVFTDKSIDIFDFKERPNLGLNDIKKLHVGLDRLIFNKPDSYNGNDIRRIKKQLIKYHSPKNKRPNLNIYIVRSKFAKFSDDIQKEIEEIEKHSGTKVVKLDDQDIVNRLLEQNFLKTWTIARSDVEILLPRKLPSSYNHLVINIPLKKLLSLYEEHVKKDIDLFAQNIRVPQKGRKFAEGIYETVETHPKNFFLFHNGITITATNIEANPTSFLINEPQVVNGAQTLGNLFNRYKNNLKEKKLKEAGVLCKIIKADQKMTDLICETSNTQKAVKTEDLRTNDSFQKKLSLYIKSESGGKYEYVRKGNKKIKDSITIKYTKFFQWVYAALSNKPAEAKNAKETLFEKDERGEYENIKNIIQENLEKIIFLCNVGIFVENFKKEIKDKQKKRFLKNCDLHIIAALFLLKSTEVKKLNKIYKILKNYSEEQIKKDRSLDNNKIFTKSDKAWGFLKTEISKSNF